MKSCSDGLTRDDSIILLKNRFLTMSVVRKLFITLLAGCWFLSASAGERGGKHHSKKAEMSRFSDSMDSISLDDAVNRVRGQFDGRILSAEEIDAEYRIRVLTGNGKVRRLRVDPATGEIIRRRR